MAELRILITGGGTGGHLFPALAIGEEIKNRNSNAIIHFVGSKFGLESKVYPIKDVLHTLIPMRGIQRTVSLNNLKKNILLPYYILSSILRMKSLIKKFSPQVIIGTGGYASAIPIFVGLRKRNSPIIILQEQNSYPGLTNRLFSNKANFTCTAFLEADKYLKSKTILTGNPIRKGIELGNYSRALKFFNFQKNQKTIFLFGGSQGSSFLNKAMNKVISQLSNKNVQVIWQTGENEYHKYKNQITDKVNIAPFIHNMADAYSIADLIISRSGALTLAEITVCKKPAILIPLPSSAADHQLKNAKVLEEKGAAIIIQEKEMKVNYFLETILKLLENKTELQKMKEASESLGNPNSTNEIVDNIMEELK